MAHQRVAALDHIRGLAMLGVVGIHAGALALANPHANIHLVALLDICTRFTEYSCYVQSGRALVCAPVRRAPRLPSSAW